MKCFQVATILSASYSVLASYFPVIYDGKMQLCANNTSNPYGTCGVIYNDSKVLYRFTADKTNFTGFPVSLFSLKDVDQVERFGIFVDQFDDINYCEGDNIDHCEDYGEVITNANLTAIEIRVSYEDDSEVLVYDLNNNLLWNKTFTPTINNYIYYQMYVEESSWKNIVMADIEAYSMDPEPGTPLNSRSYHKSMSDVMVKCSTNLDQYSYDDCPNFTENATQTYRLQINLDGLIAPPTYRQIFVMKEADKDHRWGLSFGTTKELAENNDYTFTYYSSLGNTWTDKWYSVVFDLDDNTESVMSFYDEETLLLNQSHFNLLNTSATSYLYPVWYTSYAANFSIEFERMERWITVPEYFNNQCSNGKRKFTLSEEIKTGLTNSCPTGETENFLKYIDDADPSFVGFSWTVRYSDATYTAELRGPGVGGWFKCFGFTTVSDIIEYSYSLGNGTDIPAKLIENYSSHELCDFDECFIPVNGSWSEWSAWGSCDGTERIRTRSCYNPFSSCGDNDCVGESEETESCAHGGWSEWSGWSFCNSGTKSRTRTCDNPTPSNGGDDCVGDSSENESCPAETFTGEFAICVREHMIDYMETEYSTGPANSITYNNLYWVDPSVTSFVGYQCNGDDLELLNGPGVNAVSRFGNDGGIGNSGFTCDSTVETDVNNELNNAIVTCNYDPSVGVTAFDIPQPTSVGSGSSCVNLYMHQFVLDLGNVYGGFNYKGSDYRNNVATDFHVIDWTNPSDPSYTDFYCVNVTIHGLDYTRIFSDAGEDTVYNVPWGLYAQTWEWCQEMISVFDNALTEAFASC